MFSRDSVADVVTDARSWPFEGTVKERKRICEGVPGDCFPFSQEDYLSARRKAGTVVTEHGYKAETLFKAGAHKRIKQFSLSRIDRLGRNAR